MMSCINCHEHRSKARYKVDINIVRVRRYDTLVNKQIFGCRNGKLHVNERRVSTISANHVK